MEFYDGLHSPLDALLLFLQEHDEEEIATELWEQILAIITAKSTSCGGSLVFKASHLLRAFADDHRRIILDYFWHSDEPINYETGGFGTVYSEILFERLFCMPSSEFHRFFAVSVHRSKYLRRGQSLT